MDLIKFIFHLIVFAAIGFATLYNYFVTKIGHEGFGGKFRFLTFWNACFQFVYFGLNLVTDVTETKANPINPAQRGRLQRWRDIFHSTVVFPATMFVGVTFWTLYAVDRELVYPKRLDAIFPLWLNHMLHTAILPFITIDKLVCRHHYPRRLYGLLGTAFLALLYLAWILLIAYVDNVWVYPVLKVLSMAQRAVFISVCIAFFASFYILGESVTTYVWGKKGTTQRSSSKTKKASTSRKVK